MVTYKLNICIMERMADYIFIEVSKVKYGTRTGNAFNFSKIVQKCKLLLNTVTIMFMQHSRGTAAELVNTNSIEISITVCCLPYCPSTTQNTFTAISWTSHVNYCVQCLNHFDWLINLLGSSVLISVSSEGSLNSHKLLLGVYLL